MPTLYIREWGEIHKGDSNIQDAADNITLHDKAWGFLAKYADSTKKDNRFLRVKNLTTLKVQNFVGVISTPDGTQIEILPKTNKTASTHSANDSRLVLQSMLKIVHNLPFIQSSEADLQIKKQALPEILIGWFLQCVDKIIKQGIRKDYNRIKAHEPFLKGQLQTTKQLNAPPHQQHLFYIEYDIFSANRAENRLIHSALLQVVKWSRSTKNQILAKHFLHLFDSIPLSREYRDDFEKWSKSRDMDYYQNILPWLTLILNQHSPFALKDQNAGISFLLPMEVLFEKYVAKILAKKLPKKYRLTEQGPIKYLANHKGRKVFKMKPDMVISDNQNPVYILDTKWKLIDNNGGDNKDISQADMYQLFAYGKKYNVRRVILIYPQWQNFTRCAKFKLDENLYLSAFPFDLNKHKEKP